VVKGKGQGTPCGRLEVVFGGGAGETLLGVGICEDETIGDEEGAVGVVGGVRRSRESDEGVRLRRRGEDSAAGGRVTGRVEGVRGGGGDSGIEET
jgi:hypothetical protein